LFIYPTSRDSDPLRAARLSWPKLGVLKIGSPEVSRYAVFMYGKIAVRQFPIDTLRAFCESQIRASCQGLIVHTTPSLEVALDAVGVFQMSESKRAQIAEQSIVLLDRVLSKSSGQGVFDNQRPS
jgi:hypothetical protein